MLKKLKKGFTLAELLIVVAIIAVLTAIAVPLFVTSLNKANKATDEANMRAVRVAATYAILTAEEPATATEQGTEQIYTFDGTNKVWELEGPWYVYAEVSDNGQISNLKIGLEANKTTHLRKAELRGLPREQKRKQRRRGRRERRAALSAVFYQLFPLREAVNLSRSVRGGNAPRGERKTTSANARGRERRAGDRRGARSTNARGRERRKKHV